MTVGIIAFQGRPGAYSDLACRTAYPAWRTLPCDTFEAAIEAVRDGAAQLAMLPCENSLAGRVPDIHALLPESGLFIVGEDTRKPSAAAAKKIAAIVSVLVGKDETAGSTGLIRRRIPVSERR